MEQFRGTTILCVRRGDRVAIGGDGQVSMGNTMVKGNARKVRRLYNNQVIAGFAGGTADAFTLFERFEGKLETHSGNLVRAAVELAKDWRTDRSLRRLEALLLVADTTASLMISGTGDVMEPEYDSIAIGSGGSFAQAAARAGRQYRPARRRDRQACNEDCRRHLCVYQRPSDSRGAGRMSDATQALPTTGTMTPREIVQELDKHIVGQSEAKRAVAIALRNRWRRMQLDERMAGEITPKNILMIGPTGVGKTEIARRLAKLARAPFIKVEATKFTEVGYVGREVDSIIRDLVDAAVKMERETAMQQARPKAELAAEERVLDALVPRPREYGGERSETREQETGTARQVFRKRLREGQMDDTEIEVEVQMPTPGVEIMTPPGMEEMASQMQGLFQNLSKGKTRKRKMTVKQAMKVMTDEEAARLVDEEALKANAVRNVEQNGIVFIDEIDKVCKRDGAMGGDVSREGVQRDLLPLVEGCTVNTKYGMVKTDHILFIASGAFHLAKPSDLIPELQGRLPIRVELSALTADDFLRILTEPDCSLTEQYVALLGTEGLQVSFDEPGVRRLAEIASEVNERTENIGARRLHTLLERLVEQLSFEAPDRAGESVTIDAGRVDAALSELSKDEDLSRFIL